MEVSCDFCRDVILTPGYGSPPVITYLPCFHGICQKCRASRYPSNDVTRKVPCALCAHPSSPTEFYDHSITTGVCPLCNVRTRLERICESCNRMEICTPCSITHNRQYGHLIGNSQLCDLCAITHAPDNTEHKKTSYSTLAEIAQQRLTTMQRSVAAENIAFDAALTRLNGCKAVLRGKAVDARSAVAKEVVELCNALMRRGNDIVKAIDAAEMAKIKQITTIENSSKQIKERLDKLSYFLQVALAPSQQDLPGTVYACSFANNAYALAYSKRQELEKNGFQHVMESQLAYLSEPKQLLKVLAHHGKLHVDGTINTPPCVTQHDASMFAINNGPSTSSHSSGHLPRTGHAAEKSQQLQQNQSSPHEQQSHQHSLTTGQPQQRPSYLMQQQFLTQRSNSVGDISGRMMSPCLVPQAAYSIPCSPIISPPQQLFPVKCPSTSGQHAGTPMIPQPKAPTAFGNQSFPTGAPGFNLPNNWPPANNMQQTPNTASPFVAAAIGQVAHASQPIAMGHCGGEVRKLLSVHDQQLHQQQQQHQRLPLSQEPMWTTSTAGISYPTNIAGTTGARVMTGPRHLAAPQQTRVEIIPGPVSIGEDICGGSGGTELNHPQPAFHMSEEVVRTSADSTVVTSTTASKAPTGVSTPNMGASTSHALKRAALSVDEGTPEGIDSVDIQTRALPLFANSPGTIAAMYSEVGESRDTHAAASRTTEDTEEADTEAEDAEEMKPKVSAADEDRWDDYCYVCQEGVDAESGDLGCCDGCPHVFHAQCHIPAVSVSMAELPDDWKCSMCQASHLTCREESPIFQEIERLLCSTALLSCYKNWGKAAFFRRDQLAKDGHASHAGDCITLDDIANRLSSNSYRDVVGFIEDMNLLFKECSAHNAPSSAKALAGKYVYTQFINSMRRHLPAYEGHLWNYEILFKSDDESSPLKLRIKRPRYESSITAKSTTSTN